MPVQSTLMENGLRVVTETQPHQDTVAFSIGVGVGSRDEGKHEAGISHFVEHMLFRGSKNHPGAELETLFARMAATHNACTSREFTIYSAEALSSYAGECFGLLADMVQHPVFDPATLAIERKVILEEMRDYRDMPDEVVSEQAYRASFPKQALGRDIIGKTATLKKCTAEDLHAFVKKHYRPDNMVVTMAGNITHEQSVAWVAEHFHTKVAQVQKPAAVPSASSTFQPVKIKGKKPWLEQSYCHILYTLPNEEVAANPTALAVYDHVLTGTTISRLDQKVREQLGLVYGIHSEIERGREHCRLEISASTSPRNMKVLTKLVDEAVAELGKRGITQQELADMKNQACMQVAKLYQDPTEVADTHCETMLVSGRTASKEADLRAIDELTLEQVNQVARSVARHTPSISLLSRSGKSGWEKQ